MSFEDKSTRTPIDSNNTAVDECMGKSLLEQLPGIVAAGKRKAEAILERALNESKIDLQGRELVDPTGSFEDLPESLQPGNVSTLIYGDNLLAMAALLAGTDDRPSLRNKIDLIYIDPPFDSKADYRHKIKLTDSGCIDQKPTVIEQFAYSDTWADGTVSYLKTMIPRLVLMKDLLADTGSFYIHLDHHVSHYIKVFLDELFGKENFQNEIIWHKGREGGGSTKLPTEYNSILVYKKTIKRFWKSPKKPYKLSTIKNIEKDKEGWFYTRGRMGRKPADWEIEAGKGIKTYVWHDPSLTKEEVIEILTNETAQDKGALLGDVWDAEIIGKITRSTDYGTEKPEKIIELIVQSSCPPEGLVADFFCGSGTTAAVAEKLGRRWIACDLGKPACMVTRKRLLDLKSKPFLCMNIGDYQIEQMRSHFGKKYRIGDLSEIVLGLFGANPLPYDVNPNRNLGKIPKSKTLIYCDSPNKITGLKTLKKAVELRDGLMGGWKKVAVLGWNFDSQISQHIQNLNDPDLEVLVIPPDLLDRLKKKGAKLKPTEVRFSTLQYLQIAPQRKISKDSEELKVNLQNYVLLSPEALHLDDAERKKIQQIANKDPISLIEYWGIDPNYDGITFRPVWHSYRGRDQITNGGRYSINPHAILELPKRSGSRQICVRAVDIFGFEAQTIQEVL